MTLASDPGRRAAPLEPADEAVTGARPVFALAYEGLPGQELRRARFRIVLSTDAFRSTAYTFEDNLATWELTGPGAELAFQGYSATLHQWSENGQALLTPVGWLPGVASGSFAGGEVSLTR